MRRRFLALGGALLLAVSACSGGSHGASPPTTSPPPSTTAPPDPDVIPPVITAAYVDAVFKVLNHINGNAARALVASGRLTGTPTVDLRAIYNNPLFAIELKVFQESADTHFANVKRPPGDRLTTVIRLISASGTCVFVETVSTLKAVQIHATKGAISEYWELTPKTPGDDPLHLNPTPWAMTENEAFLARTNLASPC